MFRVDIEPLHIMSRFFSNQLSGVVCVFLCDAVGGGGAVRIGRKRGELKKERDIFSSGKKGELQRRER